jgi:hypothetical protein
MTTFLMFVLLVLVLVAWGMSHSSQRKHLEATRAERNEWRTIALAFQGVGAKFEATNRQNVATIAMLRATLSKAEADRNRHATALWGELLRQARAELIKPDEPVGVASVLEFATTGRGGRRATCATPCSPCGTFADCWKAAQ